MHSIINDDCHGAMELMDDNSIDAIVADPPYSLNFMSKAWDNSGIANNVAMWREALRVLKPGGHMLAFGGTRTYHRMVCAIEDAGFEIRDCLLWLYGSGFPKSLDVSKGIDKAAGAEREVIGERKKLQSYGNGVNKVFGGGPDKGGVQFLTAPATAAAAAAWQGWGTALKPAHEPIVLCRKPLIGTVVANVMAWGTGGLNIDGCRVEGESPSVAMREAARRTGKTPGRPGEYKATIEDRTSPERYMQERPGEALGRWPANIIHDGSEEVRQAFPQAPRQLVNAKTDGTKKFGNVYSPMRYGRGDEPSADSDNDGLVGFKMKPGARRLDTGSAARFFYCAKSSKADRGEGNSHPTVKPITLMRYLCRLITPAGGVILDPFMGSGSTGKAAVLEGFQFIGIEQDAHYVEIARRRIAEAQGDGLDF